MKKLIFSAAVLASAFFAASCQQELLDPVQGGSTVTFSVEIPEVAGTKATIGDEPTSINDLVYAVYRTTASDLETTLSNWDEYASLVYQKNPSTQVFTDNYTTTVSLELINNQNYVILFWAQKNDVWVAGEKFDLTEITYPADNMIVNRGVADNYAAFSGVCFLGANEFAGQKTVELTRPFAQINIAAKDPVNYNVVVKSASMTVRSAGDSFNVASQSAPETKESLTYTWENIPATDGFVAGGVTYDHYVAMGYVFANDNVSVSYEINTASHGTVANATTPINNVPVAANYRTNIVGNLLTSDVDYNVTLDKDWADAEITVANTTEAVQAALDNATAGTVIKLHPGVNYGTLYMRPVEGGAQTKVVDWLGNNYCFETYSLFENITIVGAEGATVDAIKIEGGTYYNTTHSQYDLYPVMLSLIELKNVVIDGVTFTGKGGYDPQGYGNAVNLSGNNIKVDGLTFKNCVLNNSENNARLLYKTESTTHVHEYSYDGETYTFSPSLKDITVTGCTLNGGYMGLELRETENVTITNNEFNVADRNILLAVNSGCTYSGNVTITGNVSNNAKQRFVRMSGAGNAVVLIKDNNINNYLGEDTDYIKVTDGNNVTIVNNTISVGAQDAASAQTALDNAVPGDKIQLQPGVNYGTLIFRNTASSTVVDITGAGGDAVGNEKYRRIEDLTIIGAEGAIVDGFDFQAGFVSGSGASYIDIKNLTVKNVTFSGNMTPFKFEGFALGIDGLNIVDCKMNDADNKDRFVFQQMNGYKDLNDKTTNKYVMTSGIKNLTITGCEITGAYQVIESRAMENLAITNNTFRGIKARDMLITSDVTNFPDKTYTGYVTVTGNQSFDGEERFVRASLNNSDAVVVIKDNNIYNYKGADADYIKVEGGNNVTIENNVFAKFVYGLTLIPNGENSKIIVKDKEGFLNLTSLFADWTRLFSDGNGNEWVNYANGAGADYYYRDYWTISLEADIDLNNDTIDPVILKHPVSTGVLTFDGKNNTIKNAIIVTDATTENAAGLFDASHHDALKNLRLDNIHVTGSNVGNSSAGVLSGSVSEDVQNITITNSSVTGGKYTGGIIGNGYTDVTNCSLTNVTVKGGYKLGGVIGYICASSGTGDVTGNTLTDCTVDGIGGGVYAGGKSEYIIGKVVGNYNCNGTCSGNTVTKMTTGASHIIGKIEAGKNVTIENNVMGVSSWDELKTSIVNGDIIELDNDVTVDKWVMFSEDLNVGDGTIITIDEINVTIDGKGHTLTVNAIESAGNNDQLFQGASNLNISDLTIKYADGLTTGGLGMVSGVIKDVRFVGGGAAASSAAIFPGTGIIKVEDCTFDTNGVAIYFEEERDNLTVTGCTFNQKDNKNVILLRGDVNFTNNIINSGRTVNIVSGSPVVTGNDFKDVRFKVYSAATATVSKNIISNLEFDGNTYSSTFTDNTLSAAAQAALDAATKN